MPTHTGGVIKQGVHQDSVFGSLLFLTFINELPLIINAHPISVLFADDTNTVDSQLSGLRINQGLSGLNKKLKINSENLLLKLEHLKRKE
jgi:hypothetical protein